MAEILPMNVIGGGALIVNFFRGTIVSGCLVEDVAFRAAGLAFFNVFGDLVAIFGNVLLLNMRVIAHPRHAAPAKKTIFYSMTHRRTEIRVMLNFIIKGAFNQQRRNAANWVVIAEPPRYIGLGQTGIDSRN